MDNYEENILKIVNQYKQGIDLSDCLKNMEDYYNGLLSFCVASLDPSLCYGLLGELYLYGYGVVNQDIEKGLNLLNQGLLKNDPCSIAELSHIYKEGEYVEFNSKLSFQYAKYAALNNNAKGCYYLSLFYKENEVIKKDESLSFKYLKQAVDFGRASQLYELGNYYKDGIGTPIDLKLAKCCYDKALKLGYSVANLGIGTLYEEDEEGIAVKQNKARALEYYKRALKYGHYLAAVYIGDIYYDNQEYEQALKYYRIASDEDYLKAFYRIGRCYKLGNGVDVDNESAFYYFKQSAADNYPDGYAQLGLCYQEGEGVEKDLNKAEELYIKANQNDSFLGTLFLADLYDELKEYEKALPLYQKLADVENDEGEFKLGEYYRLGHGIKPNYIQAMYFYKRAMLKQHEDAYVGLGILYEEGLGFEKNKTIALNYYKKGYNLGSTWAGLRIGLLLIDKKEYELALSYLEKCEDDFGGASYEIGLMHDYDGGLDLDLKLAKQYYEKAISNNFNYAYHNLGILYYHGYGVNQDKEKAKEYFKICEKYGYDIASLDLAIYYDDLNQYELALPYLLKADEQEYKEASFRLGDYYRLGSGVKQSDNRALDYYNRAILFGEIDGYAGKGLIYQYSKDDEIANVCTAISLYKKGSKLGSDWCSLLLGDLLKERKEYKEAVKYYKRALKKYPGFSYYNLGEIYKNKDFEDYDILKAIQYYELAIKNKDYRGFAMICVIYLENKHLKQDLKKAIRYAEKGMEHGVIECAYLLGEAYLIKKDKKKALKYFSYAYEHGFKKAKKRINELNNIN